MREKYFRTAAWAKASYHVPFKGASPTEMDRLRSLARASTGMDGAGGCKTSIIGLRLGISWDPEVRAVQLQIKEWLKWWWTNPEYRIDAARLWVATRSRLKDMGRTRRWKNVNGPVAAMVAMLLNLGWEPEGPVIWSDDEGFQWTALQGADCEELNAAVEKTIARRQWSKAAGHFCGRGLESGVDYTVANKHVDKLRCAGLACEAGMLENIVTGGYYTRSRLRDEGLEEDDLCPRCQEERETPLHRFWKCKDNSTLEGRLGSERTIRLRGRRGWRSLRGSKRRTRLSG